MGASTLIAILLATYRGATFLPDQLRSLDEQTDQGWQLLWRDDGSADDTVAVIERFAAQRGDQVRRVAGPAGRIGVAASFHALAQAAPEPALLAFSDQDDVWLADKLARGRAALARVPDAVPALYCARQVLVDARLRRLGISPRRKTPDFAMALAGNVATGCTVMLNPAAAALLRAAPPPDGALHDWWSLLLALGAGGRVIVDDAPAVLYRQHGNNAVGAASGPARRGLAALRRGPDAFLRIFTLQLDALHAQRALLTPASAAIVDRLRAALPQGPAARLRAMRATRLRRGSLGETALLAVWMALGGRSR